MTHLFTTGRLKIRYACTTDAEFIYSLLNDRSWIDNIGDKNINTLKDAESYIHRKLISSYDRHSHGLYVVQLQDTEDQIGLCGLIKRETLDCVDLGYAFLPKFRGKGYAFEAAQATLNYERSVHGFDRVLAITLPSNTACIKLLAKLGFRHNGEFVMPEDDDLLELYSIQFSSDNL